MMLVSLFTVSLGIIPKCGKRNTSKSLTYKWNAAVCAPVDFRFISVDEDTRMSKRATASVTSYNAVLDPTNRLLVNEIDRGIWSRLKIP